MPAPATESARRTAAVIGLGPAGLAIGQALAGLPSKLHIVGHDRDAGRVQAALKAGAIAKGHWRLLDAVAGADLVVLAEPVEELVETLALVAPELERGALVTDTAHLKVPVMQAAERAVPEGVSFIG